MSKYNSTKTVVDGITFDSKAEAKRYGQLKILQRAGTISGLELQPKFVCIINKKKVCTYKADFTYFENHVRVVEDVKGFKTATYRLKKKLVEACYPGTVITEISA